MSRRQSIAVILDFVDAHRLGTSLRALRIRVGWTQAELASRGGVSEADVSRVERGLADRLAMSKVMATALALDAWADYSLRWRGGELDRVVNARHAALHEAFARWLAGIGDWELAPEVSFSIYGERGVIDALAWHARTRTLLVVELKTEIVDVSEMLGTFDRKVRLAPQVAAAREWRPRAVAAWLLVANGRTNTRRLHEHRDVLRAALPDDGRRMEGWLRKPDQAGQSREALRALSFMPERHLAGLRPRLAPPKRVRRKVRAGAGRGREAIPSAAAGSARSGPSDSA